MSRASYGKPLKGNNLISQRGGLFEVDSIEASDIVVNDVNINELLDGSFVFDPIDINSGTIDGVVIGADEIGPAFFSSLQTGDVGGTGFDVIFYGTTIGDFIRWNANNSTLFVNGNLEIRDSTDLGNINITDNTISSTNTNGDIILDPNGTGCIVINSCITQSSTTGNVAFQVTNGEFEAIATNNVSIESIDNSIIMNSHTNTNITTHNGNIELLTEIGASLCISAIGVGTGTVSITTTATHNLNVGATITIYNSNSTPQVDGIYSVTGVVDLYTFQIGATVTSPGTGGGITLNIDIASISIGNPTVTIITVNDHDFVANDTVTFSGTNSIPSLDGSHTVLAVVDETTFTINAVTTGIGSTGTATKTLNNHLELHSRLLKFSGAIEINNDLCSNPVTRDVKFYNSNVSFDDKILGIGGVDSNTSDTNTDRGFSFNWHNGTSAKTGFFGFDDTDSCFTFIPDATITNDVVSGTPGCINVGDITATNLDLQGGDITNLDQVTVSTLVGDPDLFLNTGTGGDIYLNADQSINIPADTPLTFGSDSNSIEFNGVLGFCITSSRDIKLTPGSGYDIIIPANNGIVLDGASETQKIESDGTNITVTSSSDINLTATNDINVPVNVGMTFGGDSQKLEYNGTDLTLSVDGNFDIVPTAGNQVSIPCDIPLVFTGTTADITHTIASNCTDLTITASKTTGTSDINLTAKTNINIPVNVGLTFANDNRRIVSNGTNLSVISAGDIDLTATNDINIPLNVGLVVGDDNTKLENNGTNLTLITDKNYLVTATGNVSSTSTTGDNSVVSSTGDIYLTTSSAKSVILPSLVDIQFGSATTNIESNGSGDLLLNSNTDITATSGTDINLTASNRVILPVNTELQLGDSSEYIVGDGDDIDLYASSNFNINAVLTTVSGNLQVNGTTTTVNSTTVTIDDPVFTLGGDTAPVIDDNKDRGIEFRWHNGTSDKVGFFGFDDSTSCFTFIPDATNTSEVFSGAAGCINVGDITATNLDLQNGDITNANIINLNNLHGDPDLTLTATNDINLTATNDINIPNNVGLTFGDSTNIIEYNSTTDELNITTDSTLQITSNETNIQSDTDITLNATSSVNIPTNVNLEFGGTSNYIVSDGTDLCFVTPNDIKFDAANIKLNATNSVDIPTNIPLNLNTAETSFITGNTAGDITITADTDINLNASDDVRIPVNIGLVFETTGTANKIEYNGTDLCIDSSGDIKITPAGGDTIITGNITTATWQGNVVGVTYGGTGKSSWTEGSVIFAGSGGTALDEDNSNLYWLNSTNRLAIGSNSGIDHSLTIANSGNLSFRNSFNDDTPGVLFQNANRSYTWNIYRSEGSGSNSNFHIAGGINEASFSNLAQRLTIEETGTVGINFPTVNATISSNDSSASTTITTTVDHDLETGNIVTISGADGTPNINGDFTVTVTGTNTFTIPVDTTVGFSSSTTGNVNIIDADRIDNSGTIKLHVNGCIKLAQEGLGSSCLIFGNTSNVIQLDPDGDLSITNSGDLDINTTTDINILTNTHLNFGNDQTFIAYNGTDLCIESSGDIKVTPGGDDFIINGNLFVTGTSNISGGGGGSGTVDDYIVCLGKGQDLAITSIVSSGANEVDITTTTHNLVTGDTVTVSDSNSDPVIDGNYIATVISTTVIRITVTGSVSTPGTTGNLRTKHVSDPAKDVGICIDWHDGVTTGTANANQGFFGFDRSTERFTFIPDATITDSVVSGTLGDFEFNKGYLTNLEVSTLTPTQVVFADTNGLLVTDSGMSYNSTTNTLTVDLVEANNLVEKEDFDANTILKADTDDTPVALTVPEDTIVGRLSGGQITALTASQVNTLLGTSSSFERINVIVTSSIISIGLGTPSTITTSANHGLTTSDSVTISGSDSVPSIDGTYSVTVTGTNTFTIATPTVTTIGTTGTVTPDNNPDPNVSTLVTFVNVLGESGIASGNLAVGTDGSFKHILLSSIGNSSSYELTLTLLDPGTSVVASKKLVFTCAGQSSHLIYDNVLGSWMIVNSGAFVTPI